LFAGTAQLKDAGKGSANINQAEPGSNRQGLRSVCRPQFLHDVVNVVIDRPLAYTQDNRLGVAGCDVCRMLLPAWTVTDAIIGCQLLR
jgi:hypothetical protein